MTNPLSEQVARLSTRVADLSRDRVTEKLATVTEIDPVTYTFTAEVPGADEPIAGIAAPPQFLPAVFDVVRLRLVGSTPTFQPERINSESQIITVAGLSVTDPDPVFGGVPLSETLTDYSLVTPHWGLSEVDGPTVTSTELGYKEMIAVRQKGQRYSLHSSGYRIDASAAGQQFWVNIHYTTADGETVPATPTISDPIVARVPVDIVASNGVAHSGPIAAAFVTPAGTGPVTYRFLITLQRVVGTGSAFIRANNVGDANSMWFTHHGPITDNLFVTNSGGGGTVTPAIQTYTLNRTATWGASWRESGTKYADHTNLYQGDFDDGGGNRYAAAGFSDMTAELAGGTITKVEVYLNALYWDYDDGGQAVIGAHGYTVEPTGLFGDDDLVRSWWSTKSGAKWVTLPSSTFASWLNGTYRGIVLGPAPFDSWQFVGYFKLSSTKIRITYKR